MVPKKGLVDLRSSPVDSILRIAPSPLRFVEPLEAGSRPFIGGPGSNGFRCFERF